MGIVGLPSVKKIEMAYYEDTGDPSDKPPGFLDEMIALEKKASSAVKDFTGIRTLPTENWNG